MKKIYFLFLFLTITILSVSQSVNYNSNTDSTEFMFNGIDTIKVPNNEIYLVPPQYFNYDYKINGFKHNPSHTTIQIMEIPNTDYNKYDKNMTSSYFDSQGYKLIERRILKTDSGNDAIMYIVEFSTKKDEYERIMFFTNKNKNMIWINVNYPQKMKKLIFNSLEKCLKTVR